MGSIKIAKVFGIPVFIHWSFGLLFIWIAYLTMINGLGMKFFLWYSALFIGIFVCVVLHEFGHALTARRYGVKTRDIILSPIGGIARLERLPEKPWHEFLVAIAGPLVNVFIFLSLLLINFAFGISDLQLAPDFKLLMEDLLQGSFLAFMFTLLIVLNLFLAIFNLVPAFPMDGGRILRSLLSIPMGRVKATRIASFIAQGLALLTIFYALSNGLFILALICVFVFITARQENSMVKLDELLENTEVGELVETNFTRIYKSDLIQEATNRLRMGLEKNFLVFESEEDSTVIGVLHQPFLLEAIKQSDEFTSVLNYMSPSFEIINADMNLKAVFRLMQQKGYSILPVLRDGTFIGKVDMQGLNEYLRIQQKLKN